MRLEVACQTEEEVERVWGSGRRNPRHSEKRIVNDEFRRERRDVWQMYEMYGWRFRGGWEDGVREGWRCEGAETSTLTNKETFLSVCVCVLWCNERVRVLLQMFWTAWRGSASRACPTTACWLCPTTRGFCTSARERRCSPSTPMTSADSYGHR